MGWRRVTAALVAFTTIGCGVVPGGDGSPSAPVVDLATVTDLAQEAVACFDASPPDAPAVMLVWLGADVDPTRVEAVADALDATTGVTS